MIANHTVVYVSFVHHQFTAHRVGLPNLNAESLPELRTKVAAVVSQKFILSLSRAARAEVARRKGAPVEMGWT